VFSRLALARMLSAAKLAECLARLNGLGYRHIRMSVDSIVKSAAMADWNPGKWPFRRLEDWFSLAEIPVLGRLSLLGRSIPELWLRAPNEEAAAAVCAALFRIVRTWEDGDRILGFMVRQMDRVFGSNTIGWARCASVAERVLKQQPD
jgi:hypothetical protein